MTYNKKEYDRQWYLKNKEKSLARDKEWRENNKEQRRSSSRKYKRLPQERLKHKARRTLYKYFVDNGIHKRNSCEICHTSPTHCHHDDYTKPLEYVELCDGCHKLLHVHYREKGIVVKI